MKIELSKVSSLSPDEIAKCRSSCFPMVFGDTWPRDRSEESVDQWLSELRVAERNANEIRLILWDYRYDCGPITSVRVNRVFPELDFAQMKCFTSEEAILSGLASATCQAAINFAFNSGLTSHILAKASPSDTLLQKLYSTIPLTVFTELVSLGSGISTRVPFEIRKCNPVWRSWNYESVIDEAESLLQAGEDLLEKSLSLMDRECDQENLVVH